MLIILKTNEGNSQIAYLIVRKRLLSECIKIPGKDSCFIAMPMGSYPLRGV